MDRLTEIVVLLKRRRTLSIDDIEWMVEEIMRLREELKPKQEEVE
jgi:hypothetical protein